MYQLIHKITNEETLLERQEGLETTRRNRLIKSCPGFPITHEEVPPEEAERHVTNTRNMQINVFRRWITLARLGFYKLVGTSLPTTEEHRNVFWVFPEPTDVDNKTFPIMDSIFANQRFCGCQVGSLRRLEKLPAWLESNEDLQYKLSESMLFIVSYSLLSKFETKNGFYLPDVTGIFSCNTEGKYKTECIHINENLFTDKVPGLWTFAKACFQVADATYYFVANRLCSTFLFVEPIVLFFFRNIPKKHPLYPFLFPLFDGHANDCFWIKEMVLKPYGNIHRLLPLSSEGIEQLVKEAYKQWSFDKTHFIQKLKKNDLLNVPGYAYAEDGKEIFEVVEKTVQLYLEKIYTSDYDVKQDKELQKWLSDTVKEGKVKGFPEHLDGRLELIQLISHLFGLFLIDKHMIHRLTFDQYGFMLSSPLHIQKYADFQAPLAPEEVLHLLGRPTQTLSQVHAVYEFWNELSPPIQWKKMVMSPEMTQAFDYFDQQMRTCKLKMRIRAAKRPTPFRSFPLQHSFVTNDI